ncbi:DUF5333 domain-containing protein [Planktomarina sp.]|nr:DUF5333 domain-containing protein [Planktomarina sp.]
MILTNPYCIRAVASIKALLFVVCLLPSQGMAKEGLDQEVEINEGLIAISMADIIRISCPEISARFIAVFIFLKSLESKALALGYDGSEIKAFINDVDEKDRVLSLAKARLTTIGALPYQPATYCTVGLAEIQTGSTIGKLLKAK